MPKIKPQPNVFADELLDVVGQEFRFDHPKGLAEWLKNVYDAYLRAGVGDDLQAILIDLHEANPKRRSTFRVTDFVGMDHEDIVDAFARWGDPRAAKRGTNKQTLGGHGNGGKFYMRQSFKTSRFITYKDGKLNVFGFNEDRRYGFLEDHEDREMPLTEALEYAGINVDVLPDEAVKRLGFSGGFTVVIGEGPEQFSGRATAKSIIEKLLAHPQARRVIAHRPVFVRFGRNLGTYQRLEVHDPEGRPDFDTTLIIELPDTLTDSNGDEHVFRDAKYPDARLELRVSKDTLRSKGGDRIDIAGAVGIIGSYAVHELGGNVLAAAEFVYGECYCPKLEDPEEDLVKNDREKLVEGEKTKALFAWIRGHVNALAEKIAEADAKERRQQDLTQSSAFNEFLNHWKNKFMPQLMATLFGGPGEGGGFGGTGSGTGGTGEDEATPDGDPNDVDSDPDNGAGDEGGGGDEERTGRRAPQVLLSSQDSDPLDPLAGPVDCDARHPAVYQRHQDVDEGIYWINTSRPLAQRILVDLGSPSTRWRDYMFQRYVEIILKESIREMERKTGSLTADMIDTHIDELYTRIHDEAEADLAGFLFDEKLEG
jgi:hypothetical protein